MEQFFILFAEFDCPVGLPGYSTFTLLRMIVKLAIAINTLFWVSPNFHEKTDKLFLKIIEVCHFHDMKMAAISY